MMVALDKENTPVEEDNPKERQKEILGEALYHSESEQKSQRFTAPGQNINLFVW